MRATLFLFAIVLFGLWLVGRYHGATPWLVAADPLLALLAASALFIPDEQPAVVRAAPFALALLLAALALGALRLDATPWLGATHASLAVLAALLGLWRDAPDAAPIARRRPRHRAAPRATV